MADIGVRIVGEDQASSAFRSISEASRQTANDVGGLGGAFNSMSNTIASGVVKGQAVIGLFNSILGAAQGVTSAIGGFVQDAGTLVNYKYWSSSENDGSLNNYAWYHSFSPYERYGGGAGAQTKNNIFYVRAVRSF